MMTSCSCGGTRRRPRLLRQTALAATLEVGPAPNPTIDSKFNHGKSSTLHVSTLPHSLTEPWYAEPRAYLRDELCKMPHDRTWEQILVIVLCDKPSRPLRSHLKSQRYAQPTSTKHTTHHVLNHFYMPIQNQWVRPSKFRQQ